MLATYATYTVIMKQKLNGMCVILRQTFPCNDWVVKRQRFSQAWLYSLSFVGNLEEYSTSLLIPSKASFIASHSVLHLTTRLS